MKKTMIANLFKKLSIAMIGVASLQSNVAFAQMDHEDMQMQGGNAPVDARDPHAYSSGYTLSEGPYSLPGKRQLILADEHNFWAIMADRFEYQHVNDVAIIDLQAWYGTSFDRATLKLEGSLTNGALNESSTDFLWSHGINAYYNTQIGIRLDQSSEDTERTWLAIGIEGLAPYWFELDSTVYLSDNGQIASLTEAEYELLLTQKLILQPRAELSIFGKNEADHEIGAGISDMALGVRLRYEISRQFSPYIGVEWEKSYGKTADYKRLSGEDDSETLVVSGIRFWF